MRVFLRHPRWLSTAALTLIVASALLVSYALGTAPAADAGGQSLSQLDSELGATDATQANLSADLRALDGQIATLDHQIALVRSREASVRAQLAADRVRLGVTRAHLGVARAHLATVRRELQRARQALSAQLVASYEQPRTTLISVVVDAHGFSQLLDQLQYLHSAEHSQQRLIQITTTARAEATTATRRLGTLTRQQAVATAAASTQAAALSGMNALLTSRQLALAHIESARATALADVRAKGNRLRSAIATIKAQQAAAARAAALAQARAEAEAEAAATASAGAGASGGSGAVTATPSGGWAIPAAIVMCESGGQNLPPNRAGASGYYQIIPATWTGEGGTGPAAYLAPKSEQDAIAAKLWDGGAGARNWVCAGIVGID
jgi:septal ring factor EnvC (AmiA/AmiB activator)